MVMRDKERTRLDQMDPKVADAVQRLLPTVKRRRRKRLIEIGLIGNETLKAVPEGARDQVLAALFARNGWLLPLLDRAGRHALEHDLRQLRDQLQAMKQRNLVEVAFLLPVLPAPLADDRKWIIRATASQVGGVVLAILARGDPDLVLVIQAFALLLSTTFVSECKHLDGRWWARFMSVATAFNLLLSVWVLGKARHFWQ